MQSDYGILRPIEDAVKDGHILGTSMIPHEKYMTLIRLNGYVLIDFLGRAGIISPTDGSDQEVRHALTKYLNGMKRYLTKFPDLLKYDHRL